MHKVYNQVADIVDLPIINIIDETAFKSRKLGLKTLGLLGTRYTMSDGFYQNIYLHGDGGYFDSNGWGNGVGTDSNGYPFYTMPYNLFNDLIHLNCKIQWFPISNNIKHSNKLYPIQI